MIYLFIFQTEAAFHRSKSSSSDRFDNQLHDGNSSKIDVTSFDLR